MKKCWCENDVIESQFKDYLQCSYCKTFVSTKDLEPNFYNYANYWHDRQVNYYGFPPIEQRAIDDFGNRIPFWGKLLEIIPERNSILEVGAAHGGFLHYCKNNGIERCVGIELTEEACEFAKKKFNVEMIWGDFPNIQINEKFDIVCGFDVFEHFQEPFKALMRMKELGKYIMIQTPGYTDGVKDFPFFQADEHLFIFNEKAIKLIFSIAGISIIYFGEGAFTGDMLLIGRVM
jgi:2-polyprenyl-3-methyl-5-hydroxy-6-metoxy-1,4-benzoquinol methylase